MPQEGPQLGNGTFGLELSAEGDRVAIVMRREEGGSWRIELDASQVSDLRATVLLAAELLHLPPAEAVRRH